MKHIKCIINSYFLDNKLVHTVHNHPVHFVDKNGNLSPSAFIPFCDLGGNISVLSTKIIGLDTPICNSFKEKFHNNQLCYEIDVSQFNKGVDPEQILRHGLTFIVDSNRNRQVNNYPKYDSFDKSSNIGKTWCFTLFLDLIFYS